MFGTLFTFGSSFGQTFFISLFIPSFTQSFEISTSTFANYYGLITLTSAILLPKLGKYIDDWDLLHYATAVVVALVLGIIILTLSHHYLPFILGLFLIRMLGQGLMSHVAVTASSRYFQKNRGKALSFVLSGHPIGEALLPVTMVYLTQQMGWRTAYLTAAGFLLFALLPTAWALVKSAQVFRKIEPDSSSPTKNPLNPSYSSSNQNISKSFLFAILPSYIAVPMFITALLFHQSFIAKELGVSLSFFASCLSLFALFQIIANVLVGLLIDKYSAKLIYSFHLLPLMLAPSCLLLSSNKLSIAMYFILLGISAGYASNVKMAFVAELVPLNQLGKFKSMAVSAMVFSTSIGPALFAQIFKLWQSYNASYLFIIFYCLASGILALRSIPKVRSFYST
ncbi:MFS transporter [bacterium]|nr:MFS transporter [bacterium]